MHFFYMLKDKFYVYIFLQVMLCKIISCIILLLMWELETLVVRALRQLVSTKRILNQTNYIQYRRKKTLLIKCIQLFFTYDLTLSKLVLQLSEPIEITSTSVINFKITKITKKNHQLESFLKTLFAHFHTFQISNFLDLFLEILYIL